MLQNLQSVKLQRPKNVCLDVVRPKQKEAKSWLLHVPPSESVKRVPAPSLEEPRSDVLYTIARQFVNPSTIDICEKQRMKPLCSRNLWSFPRQRSAVPVYHRSPARVFALAGANLRPNIWLDVGDRTVPYAPCDPNTQVRSCAFELRRVRCLLQHMGTTKTTFKHVSSVVASPSAGRAPYCAHQFTMLESGSLIPFGGPCAVWAARSTSPHQFLTHQEELHSVIAWRVSPLRKTRTIAFIDCSWTDFSVNQNLHVVQHSTHLAF